MPPAFTALLEDAEVAGLIDDRAQVRAMVRVEAALARVQGRLGVIPAASAGAIEAALQGFAPDLDDLAAGTRAAGVPVPALVAQLRRAVEQAAGEPAAGHIHFGATSQDIGDTALVLQLRLALDVLDGRLDALCRTLAGLADAHRATPMLARTRFQPAVPTTFGLKAAGWLAPLIRHRRRLEELRPRLLVVQFGGAAGNLAALGDRGVAVMEDLAAELDLDRPPLPWHGARDNLVELAGWLALVTGSLGKFGFDVLLLAQGEVGEVREAEDGGSSTMPQKANPVRAEALVTLARRNAGLIGTMHQAMLHAHERDGSAWALEWATLPEMLGGTGAALDHAARLAATMQVDTERMRSNLDATNGLVLAEAAAFALAEHVPRPEAQSLVKQACAAAVAENRGLIEVLRALSDAPIDWRRVEEEALNPPGAEALIRRVLGELT